MRRCRHRWGGRRGRGLITCYLLGGGLARRETAIAAPRSRRKHRRGHRIIPASTFSRTCCRLMNDHLLLNLNNNISIISSLLLDRKAPVHHLQIINFLSSNPITSLPRSVQSTARNLLGSSRTGPSTEEKTPASDQAHQCQSTMDGQDIHLRRHRNRHTISAVLTVHRSRRDINHNSQNATNTTNNHHRSNNSSQDSPSTDMHLVQRHLRDSASRFPNHSSSSNHQLLNFPPIPARNLYSHNLNHHNRSLTHEPPFPARNAASATPPAESSVSSTNSSTKSIRCLGISGITKRFMKNIRRGDTVMMMCRDLRSFTE